MFIDASRVCTYSCLYAYVCIGACTRIYVYLLVRMCLLLLVCVCTHSACTRVYDWVLVRVCMYLCLYVFVCSDACTSVYVLCLYAYVCIVLGGVCMIGAFMCMFVLMLVCVCMYLCM